MPKVKTERRTAEPQLPLECKSFSDETSSSGFRVKTEESDDLQLASRHTFPPAASASLKSGQASINCARIKNEVSDEQDLKPARRRTHHWRAAMTSVKRAADSDEYDSEAESVQSESTPNGEMFNKSGYLGFKSALVGDMANALFGINDRSPKNIIVAVYSSNKSVKLPTKALRRRLAEADPTCFQRYPKNPRKPENGPVFCNPPAALLE
ncbi:hypothetical protein CVT24_007246, partial [Panaeolus cyanescens]